MLKPFLIRKFCQGPSIFLDADTFCLAPFQNPLKNLQGWACTVSKSNKDIFNEGSLKLWGIDNAPRQQLNSGVLFLQNPTILDEWCKVFEEAQKDQAKFDYLMYRQPWSYDQIGLIIATARTGLKPEILNHEYNLEVALHGWGKPETNKIIHFTNWKPLNFNELKYLSNQSPYQSELIEIANKIQKIENAEFCRPAFLEPAHPLRAKKASYLIKRKTSSNILVGLSMGIGNVILATPMLQALIKLGWKIFIPDGHFNNNAESVLKGLGITFVNQQQLASGEAYAAVLQSVWGIKGLEKYAGQTIYCPTCQTGWKQNLYLHEVEANMSLAYAFGYQGEIPPLYCFKQKCSQADDLAQIAEPLIGLHICTDYSNWFFANRRLRTPDGIAKSLINRGWRVVLLGGPKTRLNEALYPKECINLIGKLDIPQTAYAITKLDALVTEDCGITHVAAAMDCPQVSVFGPTSVLKNRPWSEKAQVLTSRLACQPCQFSERGKTCRDNKCMVIDPELISDHVERLINQRQKSGSLFARAI
jgi:hypothetical protein